MQTVSPRSRNRSDYNYILSRANIYYPQFKDILTFEEFFNELYATMLENKREDKFRTANIYKETYRNIEKSLSRTQTITALDALDKITSNHILETFMDKCLIEDILNIMHKVCTDRECYVILNHCGIYEEPKTLKIIGDELGICNERVRQIEVNAIHKIQKQLKKYKIYG